MSYECPVCYSKCESGLVIPQSCQHKICLTCYTNIVIKKPQGPCCPQCRNTYVKQEDLVSQETTAPQNSIFTTAISNLIRSPLENLLYETAFSHATRSSSYIYTTHLPRVQLFYISDF